MLSVYKREVNSSQPDVLIIVEHIVRELESANLLKYQLHKLGLSVAIDSPKFNFQRLPILYSPKVVLTPWAYSDREMDVLRHFKTSEGKSSIIINLHQEQITNNDSMEFVLPRGIAKDVYHLCWGEEFFNALLANGCSEDTLLPYGSIRMDFYLNELRVLSEKKEHLANKYNLDPNKKWLLFVANSFHLHTEEQKSLFSSMGVDIQGIGSVGVKNTYEFFKYTEKLLSSEYSEQFEVIYRPHPSMVSLESDIKEHRELSNKHSNYNVIFDYTVRDWILNSDKVVSFHSTSYVDCFFSGVSFLSFRPFRLERELDLDALRGYEGEVNDYERFIDAILSSKTYRCDAKFISKQFYNGAGLKSYEKLSLFIADKIKVSSNSSKVMNNGFKRVSNLYIQYFLKSVINYFSLRSTCFRDYLANSKDHRVNNLAWGSGHDYYSEQLLVDSYEEMNKLIE